MLRRCSYGKSRLTQIDPPRGSETPKMGDVICEPPIVKRVTPPVADGSCILDCRLSFPEQNRSHYPSLATGGDPAYSTVQYRFSE